MMPMDLNSTPLLSYRDIKTDQIDLIEDAFGIYAQFTDVICLLDKVRLVPGKRLTRKLLQKVRKTY
jgi:hypothetical protein